VLGRREIVVIILTFACITSGRALAADVLKLKVGGDAGLGIGTVVRVSGPDAVSACGLGQTPVGVIVSYEDVVGGREYLVASSGIAENVLCAEAITAGDILVPAAGGAAKKLSSPSIEYIIGTALETAAGGSRIKIIINVLSPDASDENLQETYDLAGNDVLMSASVGDIRFRSATSDILFLDESTARLGIGTTDPTSKLEVSNAGDVGLTMNVESGANGRESQMTLRATFDTYPSDLARRNVASIKGDFDNPAGGAATWDKAALIFGVPGSDQTSEGDTEPKERMRITNNGNLGVGTNDPTARLHVEGDARVTGRYYDSSNDAGTDAQILSSTGTGTNWIDASLGLNCPITYYTAIPYGPQTFSILTPFPIPDGSCTGVSSSIIVSGYLGAVATSAITITMNITHPYDSDLEIVLVAPNGDILGLSNSCGGSGDNFINTVFSDGAASYISSGSAPFTGTYRPEQYTFSGDCIFSTISSFGAIGGGSLNPNGLWQLRAFDIYSPDAGTINSWSITFPGYTYYEPYEVSTPQRIIRGSVGSDGSIVSGGGFSVVWAGTGLYDIYFTTPFSDRPTATASQVYPSFDGFGGGGSTLDNAVIVGLSSTRLRIKTGDSDGDVSNRNFTFIVIGSN